MPMKGAHGLIGKQVLDVDGIELGYVAAEDEHFLTIAEGPAGKLRLGRRFVASVGDKVLLTGPAREIFTGLNVVDNQGEFFGVVRDTMESEDVLDSFLVEDEGGEVVTVMLEDILAIDEWIDLDVSADDVYGKQEG
jgi:sporulation protein YlmC with PRC-barrel domain